MGLLEIEVGYDALRKVQLQERNFASLSKIEDDFYDRYVSFLKELRLRLEKEFSLESAKALENSQRVLKDVFEQRKHKLFFKAFRDLKNNAVDSTGLARQEKELYNSLITLLNAFDSLLSEKPVSADLPKKTVSVEFLVDLPEIASVDSNNPMGPFQKGQQFDLSEKQASLLAKRGAVRITQ